MDDRLAGPVQPGRSLPSPQGIFSFLFLEMITASWSAQYFQMRKDQGNRKTPASEVWHATKEPGVQRENLVTTLPLGDLPRQTEQ